MENLTNWCVYMHENRVNGKKYIGITSQKPTRRWANGRGYIECPLFYAAIEKYGWDAFRHDLLFTDLRQEEAERLENELITKYQTQDPEHGYNLAAGGAVNRGFKRREETKSRIGMANRGKTPTQETRKKLSAAHKGQFISQETRDKMSRAHRRTPVEALSPDGLVVFSFAGIMEAHRATGVSDSSIFQCCNGSRASAGGYHWRYADEAVYPDA